jgi:DNA mismatch repair protein PMS2
MNFAKRRPRWHKGVMVKKMQRLDQSAHVVVSAEAVIKELIENALDAGATSIEIKLSNGGLESISCRDNGQGIPHDDAMIACQRYTTSKISSFADLENNLSTLGYLQSTNPKRFRGEALNSLCNATGSMIIQTWLASEDSGREYAYVRHSRIGGQGITRSIQSGTIV